MQTKRRSPQPADNAIVDAAQGRIIEVILPAFNSFQLCLEYKNEKEGFSSDKSLWFRVHNLSNHEKKSS